jgi:hypothetical protein
MQQFETPRRIARMTNQGAVAKNFHKIIKVAAARAGFQNACRCYVDK